MITLDSLPYECLITIVKHLSLQDWAHLNCVSKFFHDLTLDDDLWHTLALEIFGHWVDTLSNKDTTLNGGWKAYCQKRMNSHSIIKNSKTNEISPLDLIQESYTRDPWTQISCCILCSRTTGGDKVRTAIDTILSTWSTPSSMLDAREDDLMQAINPLGLQAIRYNALKSMSRDFLETNWNIPSDFKGCGRFTTDSYLIFCKGLRNSNEVEDVNLQRYLRWLSKEESGVEERKRERTRSAGGNKIGVSTRKRKASHERVSSGRCDRDARHAVRTGARRSTRSMTKTAMDK